MKRSLAHLKELGIDYELLEHKAVYTIEEATLELPGRTEVKNLFLQDDKGKRQYLVMMPGTKRLDLKKLSVILGEKKMRFVSPPKMLNMLGVDPGSVSLFCCLSPSSHHVKIIVDQELLNEPDIGMHPVVNTATVFVSQSGFKRLLESLEQDYSVLSV